MSSDASVSIQFFIKGENRPYGGRLWPQVPRVGDEVMLRVGKGYDFKSDASGKAAFRVVRVVWGVEGEREPWQSVNLEIEPIGEGHPQ